MSEEARQPEAQTPVNAGGLGEGQTHRRSDANLVGRAIRERWNIPPEVLKNVPLAMAGIVGNKDGKTRDRTAAARVLSTMQSHNLAADALADKTNRLDAGEATENVGIIRLKPVTLGVPRKVGTDAETERLTASNGNGNGNGHPHDGAGPNGNGHSGANGNGHAHHD